MRLLDALTFGLEEEPRFAPLRRRSGDQLTLPGIVTEQSCGTPRPIYVPNKAMRQVHDRLIGGMRYHEYQYPFPRHDFGLNATQLMAGHSAHHLYVVDLAHAYQSVDLSRLASMLYERNGSFREKWFSEEWFRHPDEALELLKRYCEAPEGGLIQGAPSSPVLFHLYARVLLDREFARPDQALWKHAYFGKDGPNHPSWALQHGIYYSRFVDDLVFSSDTTPIGRHRRAYILEVIRSAGFEINHQKTRRYDLERGPIVINGIGVRRRNGKIRLYMPVAVRKRLKGLLVMAIHGRFDDAALIHGLMSYFFTATPKRPYNRAELEIVELYNRFRQSLGLPQRDYSSSDYWRVSWIFADM